MAWLADFFSRHGIEQTIIVYSLVILIGIWLGKIRIFGVAFGITWILFVGLAFSYVGATVDESVRGFLKDFGLVLFVYFIGLQVGPGFFASLKEKALTNNLIAAGAVVMSVLMTILCYFLSHSHIGVMAGLMSGAVTNTPGLGAAQSTLKDTGIQIDRTMVTLAYAVAYPFGVVGIIFSMLILKRIFRVDMDREKKLHRRLAAMGTTQIRAVHMRLENPKLIGKRIQSLNTLMREPLVITRMMRNEVIFTPNQDTVFADGDIMLIVTPRSQLSQLRMLIGDEVNVDLKRVSDNEIYDALILVTHAEVTYGPMGNIPELNGPDYRISRLMRADMELIPSPSMYLQLGDTVKVVGTHGGVERVSQKLGNSVKALDVPDLAPIFFGIVLGVTLGSIPIMIPGMPSALKIGIAGGPLIVALLLSRFGGRFFLNSYTTSSANLMMREFGITLFLASVGLGSGASISRAFEGGRGFIWLGMGALITLVPHVTMGLIAKRYFRKTYSEICGLLAGFSTDPPALAFAIKSTGSDIPTTVYATIYPLTMILRIVAAQIIILLFI